MGCISAHIILNHRFVCRAGRRVSRSAGVAALVCSIGVIVVVVLIPIMVGVVSDSCSARASIGRTRVRVGRSDTVSLRMLLTVTHGTSLAARRGERR